MDTAFLNGPDKEAQKGLKNFQKKNSNMYFSGKVNIVHFSSPLERTQNIEKDECMYDGYVG